MTLVVRVTLVVLVVVDDCVLVVVRIRLEDTTVVDGDKDVAIDGNTELLLCNTVGAIFIVDTEDG